MIGFIETFEEKLIKKYKGGSVTAGTKASWSASVTDGVLSFSFTQNNPTSVTLPTATTTSITPAAASSTKIYGVGGTTSITPAKSNGTITPYTFADVTVPVADDAANLKVRFCLGVGGALGYSSAITSEDAVRNSGAIMTMNEPIGNGGVV